MADHLEVTLTGWAFGGDALGRADDGRMIFAPFGHPGERVRGAVVDDRARWARIRTDEWLIRSEERIDALCPHFSRCGGCHYQHVPYPQQLALKSALVREQLERIGGITAPPVGEILPSPSPWNYRNNMRYHVLPDGTLGLIRTAGDGVMALETCYLPEPELLELSRLIELPDGSAIEQVGLRRGSAGDPMVIFHCDQRNIPEVVIDLPASVIWEDEGNWQVLAGSAALVFELEGQTFRVSPPSFFQVNTGILPALIQAVMQAVEPQPGMRVLDLYAGVGLFSAYIGTAGAQVIAIEESAAACADFEFNLDQLDDIQLYEAPVEAALPSIPGSSDIALLDPPRSGLSRGAIDALLGHHPQRIVYLSCDLGTLARDAGRLHAGGFRLQSVTPLDPFPQTYHIETLSCWERA